MKKIVLSITILTMTLLLSGCGSDKNNDVNNDDENKIISDYKYDKTINCEAFSKEIRFMNNGVILTYDNDIYVYYRDKQYSNGTNCMKLDNDYEIALINNEGLYSSEDGFPLILYSKNYKTLSILNNKITVDNINSFHPEIKTYIDNGYSIISCLYCSTEDVLYTALKENNIYKLNARNSSEEKIDLGISENEKIIDILYSGTSGLVSESSFIRTDKNFYKYKKVNTNKEECQKYVDVECEYEEKWVKQEKFSNKLENISYIDIWMHYFITKDGKVYTNK